MTFKKVLPFVFLLLSFSVHTQNDCIDALIVCGNTGFEGLNATGVGVQELDNSNTCSSMETNSLWMRLSINTGGTLGFVLTPESPNISIDFDFFVFRIDLGYKTYNPAYIQNERWFRDINFARTVLNFGINYPF